MDSKDVNMGKHTVNYIEFADLIGPTITDHGYTGLLSSSYGGATQCRYTVWDGASNIKICGYAPSDHYLPRHRKERDC